MKLECFRFQLPNITKKVLISYSVQLSLILTIIHQAFSEVLMQKVFNQSHFFFLFYNNNNK